MMEEHLQYGVGVAERERFLSEQAVRFQSRPAVGSRC